MNEASAATPDTILIVTEEFDLHSDRVIDLLSQMGEKVMRFHTADFPLNTVVSYSIEEDGRLNGYINSPYRTVALHDIKSIWIRRPAKYRFDPRMNKIDAEYAHRETHHALYGLWMLLNDSCLWINNYPASWSARYKPLQLQEAHKVGFSVPPTLVTNNPEDVKSFARRHGLGGISTSGNSEANHSFPKLVHKSFTQEPVVDTLNGAIKKSFTSVVDPTDPNLQSVAFSPCQFQPYIEKAYELRVTVVGDRIFACEIHSQQSNNDKTHLDWRYYSLSDTPHLATELPTEISDRCLKLVRNLGLYYGAIDLIRQPDGEYVFLEINPEGQFGWIENMAGLPISNAIAEALAKGLAGRAVIPTENHKVLVGV